MRSIGLVGLIGLANAACPYMSRDLSARDSSDASESTEEFLSQYYLNDNNTYLTSDVGGPIEDQNSLSAGERGPTLLEDFIFRQKIQRFDHERVSSIVGLLRNCTTKNVGSRTRRTCPWRRCPWCLRLLRRLLQPHRGLFSLRKGQGNSHVRALFHCRW